MHTEVRVKKGEVIDRALRRLKKKLDKEGTLKELRNRRHYEKPSEIKRREAKQRRHWSSQNKKENRFWFSFFYSCLNGCEKSEPYAASITLRIKLRPDNPVG